MENTIKNHSQSKCRIVAPRPSGCVYKTLQFLSIREHCTRRGESTHIRNYTHKASPTWLLNCEMNKDDINEWRKSSCGLNPAKSNRQLGKKKAGELAFPQARAHQLVVHCQLLIPANRHTGSLMWTKQVILGIYALYIWIYTVTYIYIYNNH